MKRRRTPFREAQQNRTSPWSFSSINLLHSDARVKQMRKAVKLPLSSTKPSGKLRESRQVLLKLQIPQATQSRYRLAASISQILVEIALARIPASKESHFQAREVQPHGRACIPARPRVDDLQPTPAPRLLGQHLKTSGVTICWPLLPLLKSISIYFRKA
jgi:hypothetical protein